MYATSCFADQICVYLYPLLVVCTLGLSCRERFFVLVTVCSILGLHMPPFSRERFAYSSADSNVYLRHFSTDGQAMKLMAVLQGHRSDVTSVSEEPHPNLSLGFFCIYIIDTLLFFLHCLSAENLVPLFSKTFLTALEFLAKNPGQQVIYFLKLLLHPVLGWFSSPNQNHLTKSERVIHQK